jgi:hypothetical protein
MNTLEQFQAFLYKAQNKAFEETRDKFEKVYTQYTRPGNTSKADYRSVTASRLGPMGYTNQGGQVHKDEYAPGTERVLKFKKFTIAVITPEELMEDMYDGGRVDEDKVELFKNMTKDFADSATWTCEIIASDFQLRGTSTTATNTWPGAGRDALALFSTSHVTSKGTPVTWSNSQTSAPMNQLTLMEGVTMLENIPDETGRPLGAVRRIGIVHGRYWSWRVPELIKSVQQPDTANNNPNALNLRKIEYVPILNPYLGASETSWMLLDLDNHQLLFFTKKKPTYSKDVDVYTGNQINKCVTRIAIDFDSAKSALKNAGV